MTAHDPACSPAKDPRSLEDLLTGMRGVQLYMIRMDVPHHVPSPMEYLGPHLREHILWLEELERSGTLFLSGANADGDTWDGSGTAVVRAASLESAVAIADTEPFHREGLRNNTVHGWMVNEGNVQVTLRLFANNFSIG